MRRLLIVLLALLSLGAIAEEKPSAQIDKLIYSGLQQEKLGFNPKASDEVLLRRTYLVLAGRVPTLEETKLYLKNPDKDKHEKLVVSILKGEDFTQSFYNYYSELFRIKANVGGVGFLKFYPYIDWVKGNIRENVPYNQMVKEMLTAEGRLYDNPASGYMLRDNGMPLDNLSYTMQIFMGKDISCAQCHDDPFDDWTQMDFYRTAAFFATNTTRDNNQINEATKRVDAQIKEINGDDKVDNSVRQLLRASSYGSFRNDKATLKLPKDYKYDDGEPNMVVNSRTPFGDLLKDGDSNQFADWLISQPDFSLATTNRLWDYVMGEALIRPMNDISTDLSTNEKLSEYLAKEFAKTYDIRLFLYHLTTTEFFKRAATENEGSLVGPKLRRMTSEQIWDSLITMINGVPESIDRSGYVEMVSIDLENITGQQALDQMEKYRKFTREMPRPKTVAGLPMARAADLERPHDILVKFGTSERELIDSSTRNGSTAQVLVLINGTISNALSNKDSNLMKNQDIDDIFLSSLNRLPTIQERSLLKDESPETIIWAVLNSHEFLFIQ